jgi:hypothetical protein
VNSFNLPGIREIMDWIGSGLVALAGVLAVELVLGWAQRMRLARTGGPVPELLEEMGMGGAAQPEQTAELVESLLAEGRLDPEDLDLVTGRQGWEPLEKAALRGLLREIDRALRIRLCLAAIVWLLAAPFMITAQFSGGALILVIPAVLVAGLVVSAVSRTVLGGGYLGRNRRALRTAELHACRPP